MKMAKASENDMEVSLSICKALDSLEDGQLPDEMTEGDDCVFYESDKHAELVVDYLVNLFKKASMFRVCFGMTVILDPANEMVDPNLSHIEFHPKILRMEDQRDTLLAALKSLIKSLSDNDEEGLIEHTQPMMDARAAVEAVDGKLLDEA